MAGKTQSLTIEQGKATLSKKTLALLVAIPINIFLVLVLLNMVGVPKFLGIETGMVNGYQFRNLDLIVIGCSLIIDSLLFQYSFNMHNALIYGFISLVSVSFFSVKLFGGEKNIFYFVGVMAFPLLYIAYLKYINYRAIKDVKDAVKEEGVAEGDDNDPDDVL